MSIIENNILNNPNDFDNIYIMSDIHGCKKSFEKMLNKINFNTNKDLLIILGDVIDRGSFGVELLQKIFNMKNVILLKGNHEDMMIRSLKGDFSWMEVWTKNNGGEITLDKFLKLDKSIQIDLLNKLKLLPRYLKIKLNGKFYLLVHAGIRILKGYTLDEMVKYSDTLWVRESFLKSKIKTNFTIIFGHTITSLIPFIINEYSDNNVDGKVEEVVPNSSIWTSDNKIGIDCGIAYGGNLACLELKTMTKYYV